MCLSKVIHYNPTIKQLEKAGFKWDDNGGGFIGYRTQHTINGHMSYEPGEKYFQDEYLQDYIVQVLERSIAGRYDNKNAVDMIKAKTMLFQRHALLTSDSKPYLAGFFLFTSLEDAREWCDKPGVKFIKCVFPQYATATLGLQDGTDCSAYPVVVTQIMKVVEVI